jgi:hypothetical protein
MTGFTPLARRGGVRPAEAALHEPLWFEWLALGGLLAFGAWLLGLRGVWALLLSSDPTGITLVIIVLFFASTPWCGARSRKLQHQRKLLAAWPTAPSWSTASPSSTRSTRRWSPCPARAASLPPRASPCCPMAASPTPTRCARPWCNESENRRRPFAALVLLCTLALGWSRWPAWMKGLLLAVVIKPVPQPRADKLSYTQDLHGPLNEGMKKTWQGVSQTGTAVPRQGKKGLGWLRPGANEQAVKIRNLPAPQLPEK